LIFVTIIAQFNALKHHAITADGHLTVVPTQVGIDLITIIAGLPSLQRSIPAHGQLTIIGTAV
jgi:hypothetical protein